MWERILKYTKQIYKYFRLPIILSLSVFIVFLVWWGQDIAIWHSEPELQQLASLPDSYISKLSGADDNETNSSVVVSITGEVKFPGVFELESNSILDDLIDAAGGLGEQADKLYVSRELNLAQKLEPEQHFYIPNLEDHILLDSSGGSASETPVGKVNLNTASQEELEGLPGVGPSTAVKIIENRPYQAISELQEVSGIGEATFAKLNPLIEV